MVNSIAIVGSSITIGGSGDGFSASVIVSPIVMPSTPATAMMSPSEVSVMSVRFKPEKLGDFCFVEGAVALGNGHVFASFHRPGKHPGNGQTSQVVAVIQICHQ